MGIRTPGLLIANETLYQLSYTPESQTINVRQGPGAFKKKQKTDPALPKKRSSREWLTMLARLKLIKVALE